MSYESARSELIKALERVPTMPVMIETCWQMRAANRRIGDTYREVTKKTRITYPTNGDGTHNAAWTLHPGASLDRLVAMARHLPKCPPPCRVPTVRRTGHALGTKEKTLKEGLADGTVTYEPIESGPKRA